MNLLLLSILLFWGKCVPAHYTLSKLSRNGSPMSKIWQHTRRTSSEKRLWAWLPPIRENPMYELYYNSIRCGRGAEKAVVGVETLKRDVEFYHPGFAQAYLSRAPADLESYTGDGDWFKIAYIGAKNDCEWAIEEQTMAKFTLPKTTPPGRHLLRLEVVFGITHDFNVTLIYVNCAHIEVEGPGGGNPGPMVKFPGAYDLCDHAIWMPAHVTGLQNLTGFAGPGPPVWEG